MGEAAHPCNAESDIQQPVQGTYSKGEKALLVINSWQRITALKRGNHIQFCTAGLIRYLCSVTHVVSDPCRACILDYLHPLHRLSQVLCVQKIQIMIPSRKILFECGSGKLRKSPPLRQAL